MSKLKSFLSLLIAGTLLFSTSTATYAYSEGAVPEVESEAVPETGLGAIPKALPGVKPESQPAAKLFSSGGSGEWYRNTGTSLSQPANYSKYNLLDTVKKGDIIYESKSGFGITGHVAIVEGKFYSSTYQQYYIRLVEATDNNGIVRSILEDSRVDQKGSRVLRVTGASDTIISNAVNFCVGQLGKDFLIDFKKDTSADEPDWYCSELIWASYYNQGINVETTNAYNEPGITPRDINSSSKVYQVDFK